MFKSTAKYRSLPNTEKYRSLPNSKKSKRLCNYNFQESLACLLNQNLKSFLFIWTWELRQNITKLSFIFLERTMENVTRNSLIYNVEIWIPRTKQSNKKLENLFINKENSAELHMSNPKWQWMKKSRDNRHVVLRKDAKNTVDAIFSNEEILRY